MPTGGWGWGLLKLVSHRIWCVAVYSNQEADWLLCTAELMCALVLVSLTRCVRFGEPSWTQATAIALWV